MGRGWAHTSLRAKLVASTVAIFATVLLLSGLVTAVALRQALVGQLDSDLQEASARTVSVVEDAAARPGWAPDLDHDGDGRFRGGPPGGGDRSLALVLERDAAGTVTALQNRVVTTGNEDGTLTDEQIAVLSDGALDGTGDDGADRERGTRAQPVTVDLGGEVGTYRVLATELPGSVDDADEAVTTTVVAGLPMAGVTDSLRRAISILVPMSLLSLVAAGVGAAYLVKRNLEPLSRVAGTASRVSRLRLESGEVAVAERVPARDTDPATEVGQVGLALNNLLDTMESALSARHESEQRVRQFVADASHELRTPLASIRGYAELSRRTTEPVPASVTHALGRVESEALRMQGLVEDLLLLARLDAGRPLEREPVDLTLLCIDAVSDARVAGAEHRWVLELPDEPVEVVGDEARLRQVLTNLLANARSHTPGGTTVTTGLRAADGGVVVSVVDDGPGVPAELLPRVFERFARGDGSRNRAAGSTGLGLSIVDAVVRAHGGRVHVASVPGRTAFEVHLPLVAKEAPAVGSGTAGRVADAASMGASDTGTTTPEEPIA